MSIAHATGLVYYPHGAHAAVGLNSRRPALQLCQPGTPAALEPLAARSAVCLVGEPPRPGAPDLLDELRAYLEIVCNLHVGRLAAGNVWFDLGGPDDVGCMVLCGSTLRLSADVIQNVRRHAGRGGAVVGLRAGQRACHSCPTFEQELFGGAYQGQHADRRGVLLEIVPRQLAHPVLAGFQPFVSHGRLHRAGALAADAVPVLRGLVGGQSEVVAWVQAGPRRSFYTSLGASTDFDEPDFLKLVANAVRWTAGWTKKAGR